jgi:disulfide bond formation protein DsbB
LYFSCFLFFSFWICCRCLTDVAPLYRLHWERLFNAQHGDAWIEVVRLCTAKVDSLTMSLQLWVVFLFFCYFVFLFFCFFFPYL